MADNIELTIQIDSPVKLELPCERSTDVIENIIPIINSQLRIKGSTDNIVWEPPIVNADTRFCDFTADTKSLTAHIAADLDMPTWIKSSMLSTSEPESGVQTLSDLRKLRAEQRKLNNNLDRRIAEFDRCIAEFDRRNAESDRRTAESNRRNADFERHIAESDRRTKDLVERNGEFARHIAESDRRTKDLVERNGEFERHIAESDRRTKDLVERNGEFERHIAESDRRTKDLVERNGEFDTKVQRLETEIQSLRLNIKGLEKTVLPLRCRILIDCARKSIIDKAPPVTPKITSWGGFVKKFATSTDLVTVLSLEKIPPLNHLDVGFLYDPSPLCEEGNMAAHEASRDELQYIIGSEVDEGRRAQWERILDFTFPTPTPTPTPTLELP